MSEVVAEQPTDGSETGTCGKCNSIISVDADRCPECGYEPSSMGIIRGLLGLGAFGVFMFCILLVVIMPILMFDSLALTSGILGLLFFGGGAAVSGFFLYGLYLRSQRTPVDDDVQIFGGE